MIDQNNRSRHADDLVTSLVERTLGEVIIRPRTSAASVASMPMPMCAELRASLASSSGGSREASLSPNQRPAHETTKTVAEMPAAITTPAVDETTPREVPVGQSRGKVCA
jgi:hypothetical protein